MEARRKGILVAAAFGAIAVGALLLVLQHASVRVPESVSVPTSSPSVARLSEARCDELRDRYRSALRESNHCEVDADCVATPRASFWVELDGCARFTPRGGVPAADIIAAEWLAGGCAHDAEACSSTALVQCREARCTERPPAPIPPNWSRFEVDRALRFFGPPDLQMTDARGEDTLVRVFESPRLRMLFDYGAWGAPLGELGPGRTVLLDAKDPISGEPARLVVFEGLARSSRGALVEGYQARAFFPQVPVNVRYGLLAPATLTVDVDCKGAGAVAKAACLEAAAAIRSIELY